MTCSEDTPDGSFGAVPHYRKDPVVERWVIIAPAREQRPRPFRSIKEITHESPCPFCAGNERMTPAEVLAYRASGSMANSPGWRVRVVPNKFPALIPALSERDSSDGLYGNAAGIGMHEVIIETPEHTTGMSELGAGQLEQCLRAYRERARAAGADRRLRYVLVFKNEGFDAGATLEHAHSQLVALPVIPKTVSEEIAGARKFYQRQKECVYCAIVRREIEERSRVVVESESFIAVCPFAARVPYEIWLLPKIHAGRFENSSDAWLGDLAAGLSETLRKLAQLLGKRGLNFFIHSAPFGKAATRYYHWHIELLPASAETGGFERGSDFYINPIAPEAAARALRDVILR